MSLNEPNFNDKNNNKKGYNYIALFLQARDLLCGVMVIALTSGSVNH